ncbi:MAG: class I SAM-dependent methyltransferase [Pyrinomonadaceae bacterium]
MKKLLSNRFLYEPSGLRSSVAGPQSEAIEAVRHKLINGQYNLRTDECPCGGPQNDVIIAEVDRYGLPLTTVVCLDCGTLRLDPYLDAESLEDFYLHFYQQMYARARDMNAYIEQQQAYGTKIYSVAPASLPSHGWIFEVGCGAGGALKIFQERGYRVAGCDYSARLVAEARKNGIEHACHGTLAEIGKALGGVRADLIYLHHVFEHLNEPLDFLLTSRQHLNEDGWLVLVVPDVSRIDGFANPDGDLLVFLHLAHKFNFSLEGMRRLCRRAGYEVTTLSPDPMIKTTASTMPELWLELRQAQQTIQTNNNNSHGLLGEQMWQYLAETERQYLRRQRREQIAARLQRVSPRRILRKLHLPS